MRRQPCRPCCFDCIPRIALPDSLFCGALRCANFVNVSPIRYVAKLTLKAKDRASGVQYEKVLWAHPSLAFINHVAVAGLWTAHVDGIQQCVAAVPLFHPRALQDCKMQMIAVEYAKQ